MSRHQRGRRRGLAESNVDVPRSRRRRETRRCSEASSRRRSRAQGGRRKRTRGQRGLSWLNASERADAGVIAARSGQKSQRGPRSVRPLCWADARCPRPWRRGGSRRTSDFDGVERLRTWTEVGRACRPHIPEPGPLLRLEEIVPESRPLDPCDPFVSLGPRI